ncbi:MAG: carboxymuconolactone decarboxylase family protein [Velocimicrobium sp.]
MQMDGSRKLYSIKEVYSITWKALRTIPAFRHAKKNGEIDQKFSERVMLAVTEVNGCAICSYAHTKMALEAGLSNAEIQNMLDGISNDIPAEELQAIMFAQHYADSRGIPSKKSWERMIETYGLSKAKGILGAIRMIMLGNVYGIPWGSFFSRMKGKPDKRSNLMYELALMIASVLILPLAFVHVLILNLFRVPIIRF